MLRTQIYLPEQLRKEIDQARLHSGDSLSDYLRKAVQERLKRHKNKKKLAKDIVIEAINSVDPDKSGWKDVDVMEWQREIREDRL